MAVIKESIYRNNGNVFLAKYSFYRAKLYVRAQARHLEASRKSSTARLPSA